MSYLSSVQKSVAVVAALASLAACAPVSSPPAPLLTVPTYSATNEINAEIKGVLEHQDGCVQLRLRGGGDYVPIWPVGTVVEGGRVRLPQGPPTRGAKARLGDRVTLLGTRELPPSAARPAGCGTNFFAVVQLVGKRR